MDQVLIGSLSGSAPRYIHIDDIEVTITAHFLGSRALHGRKEVADIAILASLTQYGRTQEKIALIQTKRLYPEPVTGPTAAGHRSYYEFNADCEYKALLPASSQVDAIDKFHKELGVDVFYGLYNPVQFLSPAYPYPLDYHDTTAINQATNWIGCRIMPAAEVHATLHKLGRQPSYHELFLPNAKLKDGKPATAWRLETFVAGELMRCRQGNLLSKSRHAKIYRLLLDRERPIASLVEIAVIDRRPEWAITDGGWQDLR
ncbi:MAG: hypothetical protein AB7F09_03860 [Parvibaculaceae bacterium]